MHTKISKQSHQKNIGLILGNKEQHEVQLVATELYKRGLDALVIDTSSMQSEFSLGYEPHNDITYIHLPGLNLKLDDIAGVYWCNVVPPAVENPSGCAHLAKSITQAKVDCACLLQLLFANSQVNWVNSYQAVQFHRLKPKQLSLAKQLGATIPATYVGCNAQQVESFCRANPMAIFKPVFSGGLTQKASFEKMTVSQISKLLTTPITLQAFIEGKNIRTYVFGQSVFSAEIVESSHGTHEYDFRGDAQASLRHVTLSSDIGKLAIRIARAFHLVYTAIDWRLTPSGELIFLEANPAPMFAKAQVELGIEMDRAIVDLMLK